jgi:hypothetical protein
MTNHIDEQYQKFVKFCQNRKKGSSPDANPVREHPPMPAKKAVKVLTLPKKKERPQQAQVIVPEHNDIIDNEVDEWLAEAGQKHTRQKTVSKPASVPVAKPQIKDSIFART